MAEFAIMTGIIIIDSITASSFTIITTIYAFITTGIMVTAITTAIMVTTKAITITEELTNFAKHSKCSTN